MKKSFLFVIIATFFSFTTQAQGLFIGIQGGLHNVWLNNTNPLWSTVDSLSKDKSKDKLSSVGNVFKGGIGLQVGFDLTKHVGIVAELNYLGQGYKYQDSTISKGIINGEYSSTYIQIPVMLKLTSGKDGNGIFIMGGPNYSLLQSANLTESSSSGKFPTTTTDLNSKNYIVKQDVGITAAIGIQFKAAEHFQFTFGFKGIFGLTDLNNIKSSAKDFTAPKVNNGSIGINLGFAYHF